MLLVISLELVKLCQHNSLLRIEVSSDKFSNVGDERDHNGECLRGESCTRERA